MTMQRTVRNAHVTTNRKYSLVLPARTGPEYGGGWAAGSIIAHWFHLKKGCSGVFWVWPLTSSGIKKEDKPYFEKLIDPLGNSLLVNGREICISRKGFFYESNKHAITWKFKADFIIKEMSDKIKERLKELESYIPLFRKEYLKPEPWGSWLLIRKLNKLKEPIRGKPVDNIYCLPSFKYFSNPKRKLVDLNTLHLKSGNSFVLTCPKNLELQPPNPEMEINEYLKQFLSDNPPKNKLRESNIHDVLVLKLLKEGYYFMHEGPVKNGRYDILLKDKKGKLIAVEIKLRQGDSAVGQIKKYITELKKQYQGQEIQGVILCGQANDNLIRTAKEHGFKVIEYALTIEIPLEKLMEPI